MQVYINETYFSKLETLFTESAKDIRSQKPGTIKNIFELLLALPVNINISDNEREEYAKAIFQKKQFTSFKDVIISKALKNQRLFNADVDNNINDYKGYYFYDIENIERLDLQYGVILKDKNYKGDDFFLDCNMPHEPIEGGFDITTLNSPPANALLIIDKYIFGTPFNIKLTNLIEFIKFINRYNRETLQIPFHLTILSSYAHKGKAICTPSNISAALERLSTISNLQVQIFVGNDEHDRLYFTNYTMGNIGNPLTGNHTVFNQKFLGCGLTEQDIRKNYNQFQDALRQCKTLIDGIPTKIGIQQTRWQNADFKNRLFNDLNPQKNTS
ncbi:MAG: hypothetical protein ABI091_23325 [Ferruginibacter sp.]